MSLSLGTQFCSTDLFVFVPVPYCFDYYRFVVYFEMTKHDTCSFVFSQDCFDYPGLFLIPYKFRIICSSSVKYTIGILIRTALNLWIALGIVDILMY